MILNVIQVKGGLHDQARAAGTFAKKMKEPAPPTLSLRRLPSGVEKVIDS